VPGRTETIVGSEGSHWTSGDWDDDPEHDRPQRRRSRLLLLLAAAPWLVVLWLLGAPAGPAPEADPGTFPDGAPADVDDPDEGAPDAGAPVEPAAPDASAVPGRGPVAAPADQPADRPADPNGLPTLDPGPADDVLLLEQRGRWRVEAGAEEAAALAVVVARAWLTDHEPHLAIADVQPPGVGRYAEHLVVEAVEATAPELTVVTLLAVLLDGHDELTTTVRRLAVPIALGVLGARPAGSPWWLPGPTLSPTPPETQPIEDVDALLAAAAALEAVGYEEVTVGGLEDLGGTAVIAAVTARTPEGESIEGPVVLRHHVDRYVVAGDVLARAEPTP
jgi:hypothetical protein